jgi:hypothetical protein
MQRNAKTILFAALLIVCAALAVFAMRSNRSMGDSRASSTSVSTPSESEYVSLEGIVKTLLSESISQDRAYSGANTDERFQEAKSCFFLTRQLEAAKSVLTTCESLEAEPTAKAQFETCSRESGNRIAELDRLRRETSECSTQDLESEYIDALNRAAANGDADAQMCFIDQALSDSETFQDSSRRAIEYARKAFLRGDWRIVSLLESSTPNSQTDFALRFGNDLSMQLRMNRLLRAGARGEYAALLDAQAESIVASGQGSSASLSPSQVVDADQWAERMHRKFYARSPALEGAPKVCALSGN